MAENMMCKTQKANTPWMPKKEYLPGGMKEFLYPEEIREREIERKLRKAKKV